MTRKAVHLQCTCRFLTHPPALLPSTQSCLLSYKWGRAPSLPSIHSLGWAQDPRGEMLCELRGGVGDGGRGGVSTSNADMRLDLCRMFWGQLFENTRNSNLEFKKNSIELRFTLKSVGWKNVEMPYSKICWILEFPRKCATQSQWCPGDTLQEAPRGLFRAVLR